MTQFSDEDIAAACQGAEKAARAMAERQGLELRKSRRRDRNAPDYGCYNLFDRDTGTPVLRPNDGRFECDRTLNQVVTYLNTHQTATE